MGKGQRQRVKYMLLAGTGIIKLYLRAADISELSAKPSDTLECSKEEKTGFVFNNAQVRAGEQMLAEQDAKKTAASPLCSIGNTKSAAAHTENANPNKQKELCTLEGMVDIESIAEKEESSASALGVPESRNLGRSNSAGELAEYAMDKKNSSNLVVEKNEESMAKNEVDAAIEADTLEMEMRMKMKRWAEMDMLMEIERLAEMESRAEMEIRAEMERQERLMQMKRRARRAEMKRLAEMKDAVKLARDVFETKSREFDDARKKNNKHTTIYNKKIKEINPITEKINYHYGDPSNLKPADNTNSEKNKLINRICILTREINALESKKRANGFLYDIFTDSMKEMEKSAPFTRKITMEYNLLEVKAEEKLLICVRFYSEILKKMHERDGLFLQKKREYENGLLDNMVEAIGFMSLNPFQIYKDLMGINIIGFELYIARRKLITEAINLAANMLAMQEKVMSKVVEKEQAYRSYDAA
ncbi:hypothetical protein NEAUS03_2380, partial [Nematocida ausubeli]